MIELAHFMADEAQYLVPKSLVAEFHAATSRAQREHAAYLVVRDGEVTKNRFGSVKPTRKATQ